MRYRNDVIRSVLDMMLAQDYAPCHVARNILVMLGANIMQKQKLIWPSKTADHLLDLLKRKVHALPLQLNFRELTRFIHQMCVAIPQQYIYRHILPMSTWYLAVDMTCFDFAVLF